MENLQMNEFDEFWSEIEKETESRGGNFDRFKRALWYGGRTENVSGFKNTIKNIPNTIIGPKGLRKVIRNAPKNIITKGIGAAISTAASTPIGAFVPESITKHAMDSVNNALINEAIHLSKKITSASVGTVGEVLIQSSIDIVDEKKYQGLKYRLQDKIKGNKVIHDYIFRNKLFKTRSESENISEELRKQIKKTIKNLRKENGFLLIDRNLVKMKDAKKKIAPAIQQLIAIAPNVAPEPQSKKSFFHGPIGRQNRVDAIESMTNLHHFSDSNEKKIEVADQALRAVAETTYYAKKISGVVHEIQTVLANLLGTLDKLGEEVIQLKETLREPITTILTDDSDSKFYV